MIESNILLKQLHEISQRSLFVQEVYVVEAYLNEAKKRKTQTTVDDLMEKMPSISKKSEMTDEINAIESIKKINMDPAYRIRIKYSNALSSQSGACVCFGNDYDIFLPYVLMQQITCGLSRLRNKWTPEMISAKQQLRKMLYHELGHILADNNLEKSECSDEKANEYAKVLHRVFTGYKKSRVRRII